MQTDENDVKMSLKNFYFPPDSNRANEYRTHPVYQTKIEIKPTVSKYKVKLATIVEANPKAPFSIATTPRCRGGRYSFPGLLHFTLDPYFIMLSVKQGGIKYHFLSLWYDSTWDWTQVSRAIGEHSNR